MSATVVCDFFRVSFGKPFFLFLFFLLLRLAVFLAIVYKKEMDQNKTREELNCFLLKCGMSCRSRARALLLCFVEEIGFVDWFLFLALFMVVISDFFLFFLLFFLFYFFK